MASRYPPEFPEESRALVLAEEIEAGRALELAKRQDEYTSTFESALREYILRVFLVFAGEAGKLVRCGTWGIDEMRSAAEEFLTSFTISARYERGHDRSGKQVGEMVSNWNGHLLGHVERAYRETPQWQEYEEILLATATAPRLTPNEQPAERAIAKKDLEWEDIEIVFTSDERVQVNMGTESPTYNYKEMGFEDRRSGKPNQLWALLRILAEEEDGVIPITNRNGNDFIKLQKRMERLRGALQGHFRITSDPIPYDPERGYCSRLKIRCGPSFET